MGQSQSQNGRKEYSRKNTEFVKGIEAHGKDIGLFGWDKVSVQVCTILLAGLPSSFSRFSCLLHAKVSKELDRQHRYY
jgi:hypothetical protein